MDHLQPSITFHRHHGDILDADPESVPSMGMIREEGEYLMPQRTQAELLSDAVKQSSTVDLDFAEGDSLMKVAPIRAASPRWGRKTTYALVTLVVLFVLAGATAIAMSVRKGKQQPATHSHMGNVLPMEGVIHSQNTGNHDAADEHMLETVLDFKGTPPPAGLGMPSP